MAVTCEAIADYQNRCGECPVWDEQARVLYWTDLTGRRFYRYSPQLRHSEVLKRDLQVKGFRLNVFDGFIVTNDEGIWLWDGAGRIDLIADQADGAQCRMNDCVADAAGRLLSGSTFYNSSGDYALGKLMRVDTGGHVHILDEGFHLANGLGFSPDGQMLYFTDSVVRRIYAYDYHVETGEARSRRVLVQVPRDEGIPDGLAVDAEGFIWSAQWYGSCVVRYDPEGKVERRLHTPAKQTSCAAFGGDDFCDLFITSAGESEPMPVMPPGYDPENGFFGGPLYRVRPGVIGRPANRANISLTSARGSRSCAEA